MKIQQVCQIHSLSVTNVCTTWWESIYQLLKYFQPGVPAHTYIYIPTGTPVAWLQTIKYTWCANRKGFKMLLCVCVCVCVCGWVGACYSSISIHRIWITGKSREMNNISESFFRSWDYSTVKINQNCKNDGRDDSPQKSSLSRLG